MKTYWVSFGDWKVHLLFLAIRTHWKQTGKSNSKVGGIQAGTWGYHQQKLGGFSRKTGQHQGKIVGLLIVLGLQC